MRFTSRKFLLTLAYAVFAVFNAEVAFVDDEVVKQVFNIVALYLGVEGLRDIVSVARKPKTEE